MKPLLKPSSHSNLYHATTRSPSFGLLSRNQITRLDLRERSLSKHVMPQWGHRYFEHEVPHGCLYFVSMTLIISMS